MKRLVQIAVCLLAIFSSLYVIADHFGYTDAENVERELARLRATPGGSWLVASTIIGLLISDLLLPIPSALLMLLSGKFFGVGLGGLVAFTGTMGAAAAGFYACRLGGQRMFRRLVDEKDEQSVDAWFREYGVFAIILSRPVPMLTEVLSCLAGISGIRARTFFLASLVGHLPLCFLYSYLGGRADSLKNPWPAIAGVLLIPAVGWLIVRRLKPTASNPTA